jgi:electron transport complex protein RnfC
MKLTFRGGVHPPYHKEPAKDKPIRNVPVPDMLVVPLAQHLGAPCKAVVDKGDEVREGQLIGEAEAFVSAPIHAPAAGKVKKIDQAPHPLGGSVAAVFIQPAAEEGGEQGVSGQQRAWMDPLGSDPSAVDPKALVKRVKDAGIVGLGGAAFPTHVKLSPPPDKKIDTLIINGSECEPYLAADHRLMVERTEDLMLGIRMIARMLNVDRVIVGVEENKPDAVQALGAGADGLDLAVTETKYPEGAEKMLIKALTGREVPSGGLPMDVGVVVSNIGTAVAVCEAVRDGKPLIDRVVTVTGDGVHTPGNYLVRLGTPVKNLIDLAGGTRGSTGKLITGGPMMGLAQSTPEIPVIKGTSGVLVLQEKPSMHQVHMPCIKCARCVRACPVYLLPSQLSIIAEAQRWEQAEEYGVFDCIECGCCTYSCPSKRPIVQWIKTTKMKLRKKKAREKR